MKSRKSVNAAVKAPKKVLRGKELLWVVYCLLSDGEHLTVKEIATRVGCSIRVAKDALEKLNNIYVPLIDVCTNHRSPLYFKPRCPTTMDDLDIEDDDIDEDLDEDMDIDEYVDEDMNDVPFIDYLIKTLLNYRYRFSEEVPF